MTFEFFFSFLLLSETSKIVGCIPNWNKKFTDMCRIADRINSLMLFSESFCLCVCSWQEGQLPMVNFVLTFKQNLRRFYASDVIMLATDIYFSMFIVSNLEKKNEKAEIKST